MKTFLVILAVLALISCKKMDHYEIIGTVKNIPDNTVISLFAITENIGNLIATDTIIDGKFNFSGTLTERPTKMNLLITDRLNFAGSCDLWADYTKIKVTGSDKFLSSWMVVSNISEQKVVNLLNENIKDQKRKIDSLSLTMMADPRNRELQMSIIKEISTISKDIFITEFEVLKNNINSLTSLNELYRISKSGSIDKQEIKSLIEKFDEKYKSSLLGEGIMANVDKPAPPKVGDKAIDLKLHDINGNPFNLSDFSGKYILLDFWSLACYPCIIAAPELREIKELYKDNLAIVGISMDVSSKLWLEATKRDSVTWNNLSDGKGSYAGASSLYGISGMPTYILISPQDSIVERWEGFSPGIFKEKLAKYFEKKYNAT
jgi:peroxiredoxin